MSSWFSTDYSQPDFEISQLPAHCGHVGSKWRLNPLSFPAVTLWLAADVQGYVLSHGSVGMSCQGYEIQWPVCFQDEAG